MIWNFNKDIFYIYDFNLLPTLIATYAFGLRYLADSKNCDTLSNFASLQWTIL